MNTLSECTRPEPGDRFVQRFEAAWRSHDRAQIEALLHPDAVLIQPLMATLRGRDAAVRGMAKFLELIPDLEITIDRAMREGDRVFVAFRFAGHVGRKRITLGVVDQIDLTGGLVRARTAFFDPTPLLHAVLSQPLKWPRVLRLFWRVRPRARASATG